MAKQRQIIDFELLWKKIHTKLTDEEEATLQRWLSENSKHRAYFKDLQQYYQQSTETVPPPLNATAAWEKISKELTDKQPKRRTIGGMVTGIAASLVMLFATWYFWPAPPPQQPVATAKRDSITPGTDKALLIMEDGKTYDLSQGSKLQLKTGGTSIQSQGTSLTYKKETAKDAKPVFNTLKVPRGGQFMLTLSDGTRVWLNAETTLRYPVHFTGTERKVMLSGEAYFEVSKNKAMPFRIQSNGQLIEVVGTAFNLSSYPDDSLIATTLIEGKVKVSLTGAPETQTTLLPGNQSILIKGKKQIKQQAVDTKLYTAWKDGKFIFMNQPLEEMMKTLARWYDVEVIFNKESSKKLSFTGEIEKYKEFEKVLLLIEKTNEVSFKIKERRIIID